MNETALYLDFDGLEYRCDLPAAFIDRFRSDYGAFEIPVPTVRDPFRLSVSQGLSRRGVESRIGDDVSVGEGLIEIHYAREGRETWEGSIRPYLSTHAAWQMFERSRHVRLHGGLVCFNGKNVLISGPSGAGKTSLTLALSLRPGAIYFSHEMVFAKPGGGFLGWPQPFTVSEGTLGWLERNGAIEGSRVWVEMSNVAGMKHRIGIDPPTLDPKVRRIDCILFPMRAPGRGEDGLFKLSRDDKFARLAREIEYPVTHNYSPAGDLRAYAAEAMDIAYELSEIEGYKVSWWDDQNLVVDLIEEMLSRSD